jgi:hypothetical protein
MQSYALHPYVSVRGQPPEPLAYNRTAEREAGCVTLQRRTELNVCLHLVVVLRTEDSGALRSSRWRMCAQSG